MTSTSGNRVGPSPRAATMAWVWVVVVLLFWAGSLSAQEEGTWRIVVRQNVTQAEADRIILTLGNLPDMEKVAVPNGGLNLYVGRFPTEGAAQQALQNYLDQGMRLGTVGFVPAAGPTPIPPTPTQQPLPTSTPSTETAAFPPPTPAAVGMTPAPTPSPSGGGSELPWGLILGIAVGVLVLGGGVYFFLQRRNSATPPPAPVPLPRPTLAPPPSRPKPAASAVPAAPKPKPPPPTVEPELRRDPAPPAKAPEPPSRTSDAPIRMQPPTPLPVASKPPIAMPDVEAPEPAPTIQLNDIFTEEFDSPVTPQQASDDSPHLDFLLDEEPKAATPVGNGSFDSGDAGFALAGAGSRAATATPFPPESTFAVGSTPPPAQGGVVFEQDLAGTPAGRMPSNWSGTYDYAKLTVFTGVDGNEDPCLRYDKETGIGSAYFSCHFPEVRGRLAVEFDIRCDDKNKYLLGFYVEKDQDFRQSVHALIHRTNAKASPVLRLQNESVPYEFGTWRRVRYEIDLVRHIIDGFVDEQPLIVGQRLTSCPDSLNTLSIRDNLATTGILMLRNIRIRALD